ncbi:MAG: hypothetical protein WBP44_16535 [Gammaproteobacteria bacterium]
MKQLINSVEGEGWCFVIFVRLVRRHLWRGGHDPDMVKSGLQVRFEEVPGESTDMKKHDLLVQ